MAALARIMPKSASPHSMSALANEDAPPIEADNMVVNAALSIRNAANPPINPDAKVPSSLIGPQPPAPGREDCNALTICGIPKKANNPRITMDANAEMDSHTHRLAPNTLAELTRNICAIPARSAKARNAPARAIQASRKKVNNNKEIKYAVLMDKAGQILLNTLIMGFYLFYQY